MGDAAIGRVVAFPPRKLGSARAREHYDTPTIARIHAEIERYEKSEPVNCYTIVFRLFPDDEYLMDEQELTNYLIPVDDEADAEDSEQKS